MTLIKRITIVVLIVAVFGIGFFFGKTQNSKIVTQPEDVNFSLFWEAWNLVKQRYVEPEEINNQDMVYGSIAGMVESLEDPYTVFFQPDETEKFLEDVTGRFEGVGMEIGIRKGNLQVIAPLEGTPAKRAGLRPGDIIVTIDEESARDITIEEAVSLIRGPKGTEVTLGVVRDDWPTPKEFKIERAVIEVPSLKWELIDGNIAHINLYHFSEKATADFKAASMEILNSGADRIILDLRSNPGGYLEVAQDIAGWFLEKESVVVVEDFGSIDTKQIYKAEGNSRFLNYPLVVLVNQGSASASEILAAALRDNREVPLVGETSFGKGSVQQLQKLSDGSSIKITIARWLTPSGKLIKDIGLKPDYRVEITEEDLQEDKDPQLEKAIELIKDLR